MYTFQDTQENNSNMSKYVIVIFSEYTTAGLIQY